MFQLHWLDQRSWCNEEFFKPGFLPIIEFLATAVLKGRGVELGFDGDGHDVVQVVKRAPESWEIILSNILKKNQS